MMNIRQQFSLKSILTSQKDIDMLHIQVSSLRFKELSYYNHFQYRDFTDSIRFVFENITKIYMYLQKKDLVYFDEEEGTVNLCVEIAGQIKQFPIVLNKKQKSDVFLQKKQLYEQQNQALRQQINQFQMSKANEFQEIEQLLMVKRRELNMEFQKINILSQNLKTIQQQIIELRKQSQEKMNFIRQFNPNHHSHRPTNQQPTNQKKQSMFKESQKLENTRKFWIQQTKKIKGQKLSVLKNYINDLTKFDKQKKLQLKSIQLKKMQIVEVFNNLQILNLSKNKIRSIEGLTSLKYLLKLNLSENFITQINGLQNNIRLIQLIINKNQIKFITNIFHLSQLQTLSLNENEIQEVPKKIAQLYKLSQLQLIDNKIIHISKKIESLKNLKIFFINGNKCYKDQNKSKQIINRLMKNEVKTAFKQSFIKE